MFNLGEIWAYPTDTSWGLGVRVDDVEGLQKLQKLKGRGAGKFLSLMVRNEEMLRQFSQVPDDFPEDFFAKQPRTAILKPKEALPKSIFWPVGAVAFRVCQVPAVAEFIKYPITATSANVSGESPLYAAKEIEEVFGGRVQMFPGFEKLPSVPASEIWDFTGSQPQQVR